MLKTIKTSLHYTLLLALAACAVIPFLWLLSTALKSGQENIYAQPPQWIPQTPTLDNVFQVFQKVPFAAYFINSAILSLLVVGSNLLTSILAAYPMARMTFRGKNSVFILILMTMMIPFQVIMIPLYLLVLQWQLTDNISPIHAYLGLIFPFVISGFGIFFLRQAFASVPKALEESAQMDGCSHWQQLWHVFLPLIRPSLATLTIFSFMSIWAEFLWPSIVLSQANLFPLPVGLVYLQSAFSANWRLIAAGSILSTIPVIILFLCLQRYFISDKLAGALKG